MLVTSGPCATSTVRTPMFCTTTGSMITAPVSPAAGSSSYSGTRAIPIALLPGRSEIDDGPIIGSHQYLIWRSPPGAADADADAFSGVNSMWQIGHLPG